MNRLGRLVGAIGTTAFGSELFAFFNDLLDISQCTVFMLGTDDRPSPLLVGLPPGISRSERFSLAEEYAALGYHHDPSLRNQHVPGHHDVFELRADELTDASYRRRFYDDLNLQFELVLMEQRDARAGARIYMSLYRSGRKGHFNEEDVRTFESTADFITRLLHRHRQLQPALQTAQTIKDEREQLMSHLRGVLLSTPHRLSPREAEVCASIMLGYSARAISLNSGMSANTVATHRKRAYAKLKVCSQNELFGRYFSFARRYEEDGASCPVTSDPSPLVSWRSSAAASAAF